MITKNCLNRFFKSIIGALAPLTGKLSGLRALRTNLSYRQTCFFDETVTKDQFDTLNEFESDYEP